MRAELTTENGPVIEMAWDGDRLDFSMWDEGWCHGASASLTDRELCDLIAGLRAMREAKPR